jgi:hypothetical protein
MVAGSQHDACHRAAGVKSLPTAGLIAQWRWSVRQDDDSFHPGFRKTRTFGVAIQGRPKRKSLT